MAAAPEPLRLFPVCQCDRDGDVALVDGGTGAERGSPTSGRRGSHQSKDGAVSAGRNDFPSEGLRAQLACYWPGRRVAIPDPP